MKTIILFASIALASGVLFANVYSSIVDMKCMSADIPKSLEAARQYFKTTNPGNFFRIFSPLNQLFGLLTLILFWKSSMNIRVCLATAFALYVLGDVFTFAYFYPRNKILMETPLAEVETLRKTLSEWSNMNWLRSLIGLTGLIFSFLSLHRIYSLR